MEHGMTPYRIQHLNARMSLSHLLRALFAVSFLLGASLPAADLPAEADARQAVRVLRKQAAALQLDPNRIGICGFSAGGQLALKCALYPEPKRSEGEVGGEPDFAGLFYPGIPDDVSQVIENRTAPESATPRICPVFMMIA